jgi:rRNA pseudouridine-1189 N-methylase Emg1 (Nep1/Mra1 family)
MRERYGNLHREESRSWIEFEKSSSAKNPKRGEEVVEKRTSGYGDGIKDSRLNGAISFEKKKEKIEKKDLKEKSEGGGEVVFFGMFPRGRPRMESPSCVKEEV